MDKPLPATSVADLLAEPQRWTKGHLARDTFAQPVGERADAAVSFCLVGAVCRVYDGWEQTQALVRLVDVLKERGFGGDGSQVAPFNDDPATTHEALMEVVREARI